MQQEVLEHVRKQGKLALKQFAKQHPNSLAMTVKVCGFNRKSVCRINSSFTIKLYCRASSNPDPMKCSKFDVLGACCMSDRSRQCFKKEFGTRLLPIRNKVFGRVTI